MPSRGPGPAPKPHLKKCGHGLPRPWIAPIQALGSVSTWLYIALERQSTTYTREVPDQRVQSMDTETTVTQNVGSRFASKIRKRRGPEKNAAYYLEKWRT